MNQKLCSLPNFIHKLFHISFPIHRLHRFLQFGIEVRMEEIKDFIYGRLGRFCVVAQLQLDFTKLNCVG